MKAAILSDWAENKLCLRRRPRADQVAMPPAPKAPEPVRRRVRTHKKRVLQIQVTESQRQILHAKAEIAGTTLTDFILAASLPADYKSPISKEVHLTLLSLNRELTCQGYSLRRIAEKAHLDRWGESEVGRAIEEIKRPAIRAARAVKDTLLRFAPRP